MSQRVSRGIAPSTARMPVQVGPDRDRRVHPAATARPGSSLSRRNPGRGPGPSAHAARGALAACQDQQLSQHDRGRPGGGRTRSGCLGGAARHGRAISPRAAAATCSWSGTARWSRRAPVQVLPGISRQTVIEIAAELGIPCREADLDLYDAYAADEAFLTSTSLCLCPVRSVNGMRSRRRGGVRPGDATPDRRAIAATRRLRLRRPISSGTCVRTDIMARRSRSGYGVGTGGAQAAVDRGATPAPTGRCREPCGRKDGHERNPATGVHRRAKCGDQGSRACLRSNRSFLSRHPGAHHRLRRGGTKAFEFGPIRLWIDRMPHLAQGEMWLELVAPRHDSGRQHLEAAGVVRCNEVEKLPPDLDGFWILNPAGIVHLVCSPEPRSGRGATRADAIEGVSRTALATAARAQAGQLDRCGLDLEAARRDAPRERRGQLLVVGSRRRRRRRGR